MLGYLCVLCIIIFMYVYIYIRIRSIILYRYGFDYSFVVVGVQKYYVEGFIFKTFWYIVLKVDFK